MLFDISVRIISLLSVILAARTVGQQLNGMTVAYTFAHYIFAYLYGRKKIVSSFGVFQGRASILFCLVAAYFLSTGPIPLVVAFGFHYVFNEIYAVQPTNILRSRTNDLNFNRFFLFAFSYLFAIRDQFLGSTWIPVFIWGLAVSMCFYLLLLHKQSINILDKTKIFVLDNITTVAAIVSIFGKVDLLAIVLYHVIFWTIYPLPKFKTIRLGVVYLVQNYLMALSLWAVSPDGNLRLIQPTVYLMLFNYNSFLHIFASTLFSSAHPQWLRRISSYENKSARIPVAEI